MDFSKYLGTLPTEQLSSLYDSPWTCQAVLRSLPPLAQQFVLRLLYVTSPVPDKWIQAVIKPEYASRRDQALELLKNLQVILHQPGQGAGTWILQATFKERLQQSVLNPASIGKSFQANETPNQPSAPSIALVNEYGEAQWQAVLLALVDGRRAPLRPHPQLTGLDTRRLFTAAKLLDADGELTHQGFKFLFQDGYSQLWMLLQQYLTQLSGEGGRSLANALSFLLQLSFQNATQALPLEQLSTEQRSVAAHMTALGILKAENVREGILLRPTYLAAMLCGAPGSSGPSGAASVRGFIVVETSFRVYAYTASPVQIAILQLFVRTDCLLPNMFVGTLTSSSVTEAVQRGITAQMIVSFLEEHRHPKVAHRSPVVPEAVKDQTMLWEREMNRVRCTSATLYDAFESTGLFERALAFAEELGVVLFKDEKLKRLLVQAGAHDKMRAHIRTLRQAGMH